jgi:hypothetical protein
MIFEENINFPSVFIGDYFFCKIDENYVLLTDVRDFRELHKKYYPDMNYKMFLTQLLNQKIVVQIKDNEWITGDIVKLNEDVERQYNALNIDNFISLYCEDIKTCFVLNRNVPREFRNTIFYFLFINNYLTGYDDNIGCYIISKTSRYYENKR